MSDHKYRLGQVVNFDLSSRLKGNGSASCKIVRLLSTDGDDPQYRVRLSTEIFERVARESQLSASASK